MQDGQLDKKHYRTFNVKGPAGSGAHNDDYGAMYEVLARRFRRGQRAQQATLAESAVVDEANGAPSSKDADTEWELPDLFVVDGGRGQLAVALAAARDLGLHNLPVVGLAKERPLAPAKEGEPPAKEEDRVYLPNQKIRSRSRATPRRSSSSRACGTRRTASRIAPASASEKRAASSPRSTISPASAPR